MCNVLFFCNPGNLNSDVKYRKNRILLSLYGNSIQPLKGVSFIVIIDCRWGLQTS